MAQWIKLQQLDSKYQEQIDQLYDDTFPMEIRQYLSNWIESHDWDHVADVGNESLAIVRFADLLLQLDHLYYQFTKEKDLVAKRNILRIKQNLQKSFQKFPVSMAMTISKNLSEERKILASAQNTESTVGGAQSDMMIEKQSELDNKIKDIRNRVQETEQNIKNLEDLQDEHHLKTKTMQNGDEANREILKDLNEQLQFTLMFMNLNNTRQDVVGQMNDVLNQADPILHELITVELPEWKHHQQMACIGGPDVSLDPLQNWFTAMAECLLQVREQLTKLLELEQKFTYQDDPITQGRLSLEGRWQPLFNSLIANSIVVERQPCIGSQHPKRPLVLKTCTYFTVKLRLLIKLQEFRNAVKVELLFDKDLTEKRNGFRQFNVLGTTTKFMDMDKSNGMAAEFCHLELKNKVGGKRTCEGPLTVTEELHSFSFQAEFRHSGVVINLETTSLPVVVISNMCQLPSAWASILWYNMLTTEPKDLTFFRSPPKASWGLLSKVLSWQFSSVTKRGLNAEQLSMLGDKLLGENASKDPEALISWTKFCKSIGKKSFTFWLWIEHILDLITKHLLALWDDGCIMGFVSRERVNALLKDESTTEGTFLLRFSETHQDGAITLSWVDHSSEGPQVHFVEPYTKQDLSAMSFPETIYSYKWELAENVWADPLHFLYPDIPKDIFKKYLSNPKKQTDGYEPRPRPFVSQENNGDRQLLNWMTEVSCLLSAEEQDMIQDSDIGDQEMSPVWE